MSSWNWWQDGKPYVEVELGGKLDLEVGRCVKLDLEVEQGGTEGHSAAWSLHVAGQSWRHEEHLGEEYHVADVDPHLDYAGDYVDHLVVAKGEKQSPYHLRAKMSTATE